MKPVLVPKFVSIGNIVIEFNEKDMDKMGNILLTVTQT